MALKVEVARISYPASHGALARHNVHNHLQESHRRLVREAVDGGHLAAPTYTEIGARRV